MRDDMDITSEIERIESLLISGEMVLDNITVKATFEQLVEARKRLQVLHLKERIFEVGLLARCHEGADVRKIIFLVGELLKTF